MKADVFCVLSSIQSRSVMFSRVSRGGFRRTKVTFASLAPCFEKKSKVNNNNSTEKKWQKMSKTFYIAADLHAFRRKSSVRACVQRTWLSHTDEEIFECHVKHKLTRGKFVAAHVIAHDL